ncbi:MAG: SUMF1/EgtB/PvdO family nonheme iron enzyme, partial [bacterium]
GNVAGLYLQGDKNKDHSDFVQDKLFVDLLLNNDSVRLVVFNACHSYKIALLLAKQGLSAIGMRHEILDKAAYWFSYRFYRELANGQPVDVAVNSARFAIRYYHSSDTRDWGSVILFLPQGNPDLFKVLSDKRLIQVSSNPDKAIIVVNTTKTDKITPGTLYAKLNEPYHITVQKEGYKIPKSRKITITSNEPISIDFALERESGNLDVQTKPAESGIEIQFFEQTIKKYKKLGVTDTNGYFQLSMPTGIYNFKAKMFSAKDKIIKEIEKHNEKIESDKTTTILFNFETETKYRFLTNFNRTKMLLISTVATLIFIISFFLIGFLNTYKVPEGMVRIPAGNFVKGGEDTPLLNILRKYKDDIKDLTPLIEDAPSKGYIERGFFIDKYEVTNLQYRRFIRATNRRPPKHWENGQIPAGEENYPVVNVTWYDARAYAKWAGKRLLTDDEWERAARGTDGRLFPWGNEFDENKCNSYESPTEGLVDVYEYDNGKSLEGAFNMVGNVYEWTKGKYIENGETVGYIIKGGGYLSSCELYGLAYYKIKAEPNYKSKTLGFRCALTSSQETNPPDNMVYIPSGEFIQGSEDNYTLNLVRELNLSGSSLALLIDSKPESVFVKEYFIDKYEVTNKQYRQFLDAVGDDRKWSHPDEPKEKTSQTPEGWKDENLSHEDQPVVGIDWFDAYAYAKWAGKRLPTDNEWEKAARGDDGRYYPWGNEFDIKKFRGGKEDKEETISVYQFSPNNCSYMISAMAGNACEWVNGYKDNERVVRGGAWNDSYLKVHALTFVRLGAPAEYRKVDVGFRCAKDRRFSFIEKILGKNKLR